MFLLVRIMFYKLNTLKFNYISSCSVFVLLFQFLYAFSCTFLDKKKSLYVYRHKSKAAGVLQMTLNTSESQPKFSSCQRIYHFISCEADVPPAQRAMASFTVLTCTSVFNKSNMGAILSQYVLLII